MNSLHPSTLYLMIEAIAIFGIVLLGISALLVKKHLDKKKNLIKLVDNITSNAEQRRLNLEKSLSTNPENTLDQDEINIIIKNETQLYQFMITLFTSRNSSTILDIEHQIERYTNNIAAELATQKKHVATHNQTQTDDKVFLNIQHEIADLKSDVTSLNDKTNQIITEIKDLSVAASAATAAITASAAAAVATTITTNDIPEAQEEAENNFTEEVSPLHEEHVDEIENSAFEEDDGAINLDEIIDISQEAQTETSAISEDEIPDIDAILNEAHDATEDVENSVDDLLDEVQQVKTDEPQLEEIPDDLLDNDELSVNDAASDIDALFDAVARENIEKSSEPA